jgi:hypothetical protein
MLYLFLSRPKTAKIGSAHSSTRTVPRSPPRPGRNLGLGRESGPALAPAWAEFGPIALRRRITSDGRPAVSLDQKQPERPRRPKP